MKRKYASKTTPFLRISTNERAFYHENHLIEISSEAILSFVIFNKNPQKWLNHAQLLR